MVGELRDLEFLARARLLFHGDFKRLSLKLSYPANV
jgi:hypothetical protein